MTNDPFNDDERLVWEADGTEPDERFLTALRIDPILVKWDEAAERLRGWQDDAADVAILIGGADGLTDACRNRADAIWSLSQLTLPHALVRVVLAEQIYRASTILQGHPYHRE